MIVLGVHSFVHDSGACVAGDQGVCAISEERLNRIKQSPAFPNLAIAYVLKEYGIKNINQVDLVVYDMFERQGPETLEGIRALGYRGRAECIRHHDAHAASAYFASPFDDAAVLVVDGAGSNGDEYPPGAPPLFPSADFGWTQEVQSFFRGRGNGLDLIHRTFATPAYSLGIGLLYGLSCEYLGFGKLDGGKLMGLAAHGAARGKFRPGLFTDAGGDLLIAFERMGMDAYESGDMPEEFRDRLRREIFAGTPGRRAGGKLLQSHKDAAYYVQARTEGAMLELGRRIQRMSGARNLCLAGGVALNGPANTLIADQAGFDGVFIQPAANDSGICLGCALYGLHVLLGREERLRMEHTFLGREYSGPEIDAAIAQFGSRIRVVRGRSPERAAARAIAEGKIAGWFRGACEFGPRALGHRSILADPANPSIKKILDTKVKFREPFRPYAPAVLEECAGEFFEFKAPSPFMMHIVAARSGRAGRIPAVLHVDGTARIQTVNRKTAPGFHALIREFQSLTGLPMVLNTSMNVSGEPIVETPEQAIQCLLKTGMDTLFLEGVQILKIS